MQNETNCVLYMLESINESFFIVSLVSDIAVETLPMTLSRRPIKEDVCVWFSLVQRMEIYLFILCVRVCLLCQ